ncbi:sigma-70 family RNA polymerase sigma factor [Glutamicibacter sp.]|uniref:RNA polymerase sigma factor n=1 Tax=Glutamicibacter sp. TaxID=1931995 RepID=UPI0028BF402E|nr:sigma-70 family RNA polymerase sigma factor [Glutamicibacter sp.]
MKAPFEQIVHDYGLNVLRVCRAILDEHRAQDAWSETFLSALKAYPELDDDANVVAWLVRIAHRKAIDELRRQRPEIPWEQLPDAADETIETVESAVQKQELWQQVKQLPDKQRLVLAYRYLGGLSYAEIAQILNGTEAAARRAAADGVKKLRTLSAGNEYFQELS